MFLSSTQDGGIAIHKIKNDDLRLHSVQYFYNEGKWLNICVTVCGKELKLNMYSEVTSCFGFSGRFP